MDDTIAAIATPAGAGGLAVIRISGPGAITVAGRIFRSGHAAVAGFASHTLHLGRVFDGAECADQVLLAIMRAPQSYTGEDTIELSCHGGRQTSGRVLGACLQSGARLAEPGEFTRRAFLNGRLDLTQAEAVLDMIQARTERAQRAALRMLEGHLARRIKSFRDQLAGQLAFLEAHIDFPEEDLPALALDQLQRDLEYASTEAAALLATAPEGRLLREGAAVAIVGRPNAGKSSLMNALLGEDRSIVTDVPGTTRDTVEEAVSIEGVPVRLIDTAGLREARGVVESHGVRRTAEAIEDADLVLMVIDSSRRLHAEDRKLWLRCTQKQRLLVLSKCDLPKRVVLAAGLDSHPAVWVSAVTMVGMRELREGIAKLLGSCPNLLSDSMIAINARQEEHLRSALEHLTSAKHSLAARSGCEIIAQALHMAIGSLDVVTGTNTREDILDRIFSAFCIGK